MREINTSIKSDLWISCIFVRQLQNKPVIKTLGKIARWFFSIVLGLYLGIFLLLNIPYVQQRMTVAITQELKTLFQTDLSIGNVSIGTFNRVIIDNLILKDQSSNEMLRATRLSAKIELLPLFKGKIAISNVQLFGFNICLQKKTPQDKPNFQFLIDAFAPQDTLKPKRKTDLRINAILIRRGRLTYDVLSEPTDSSAFNINHLDIKDIIAHISLKALKEDSVNIAIKRLSLQEHSGFSLNKLSMKFTANPYQANLENFSIALPNTSIQLDTFNVQYNNPQSIKELFSNIRFKGGLHASYITLKDIACFVPAFKRFNDPVNLNIQFNGTTNQLECPVLSIHADNHIVIDGHLSIQDYTAGSDAYLYGNLSKLYIRQTGIDFLFKNLTGKPSSPILQRMGDISFNGEISGYLNDLVTYGTVRTDVGFIKTDLKLSLNKEKAFKSSSGSIQTVDFQLGKLLNKEDLLGNISLNAQISATQYGNNRPTIKAKALLPSLDFKHYTYKDITLDGIFEKGGFDGNISINDPNGKLLINGDFNLGKKIPTFNFQAKVQHVKLNDLHLIKDKPQSEFSLLLNANFEGNSIDNMVGYINIDSIRYLEPQKNFFLDNINITASQISQGQKALTLNSPYVKAAIRGKYSYQSIPASVLKTVERYIPSLLSLNKEIPNPDNNFTFDVHLFNTEKLTQVFGLPFTVYTHSTIKGYFNDPIRKLRVEGYFPSIRYGNHRIESGMLLCETPRERFKCLVRGSKHMKDDAMLNFSVDVQARNDKMSTLVNWGNNGHATYSGCISALTDFFKTVGEKPLLQANIQIQPTDIIINDTLWNLHPAQVAIDSGRVFINDFFFNHNDQFIRINGKLTKQLEDTVHVQLNDISIGYVFDAVNLKAVDFKGHATGTATANQVLKEPELNAKLFVKHFTFNDALLGDMNITGGWDKEEGGIFLDAHIFEPNISQAFVKGLIVPKKKGLDLDIKVNNTSIEFLQYYMKSIASDVRGRITGKAHFYGGFQSLMLDGDVMADASMKFDILNTTFQVKDSIHLRPSEIQFNNCALFDPEGHRGTLNGHLRHTHFKDLNYRFLFNVDNLLVYNTKEDPSMPFYGTVYATGNALLNGDPTGLNVDVAMRTNRNTNFVYILNSTSSATDNQFIKFVDKTPKRAIADSVFVFPTYRSDNEASDDTPIDIHLNLQVDATPDGTMKIIMDPTAGDYISGKGNGNIRVEFFNKGDVKMFGSYNIDQGLYKFSLQEVIRKDFLIKSGSTIEFNGNPVNANLGIQALYTVNSAALSDLGIGESFTQNNVKVNCIMNLTGKLTNPDIKFDIELPNVSEEEREIVRSAISTNEEMNMQILYLLGIGKFYTYDYMNNNSGQTSSAMSSVLSSTLSGQLNQMLSQALDLHNWNFGTMLSTGEKGWTDVEVEGILSGQLLNNRLLINGNFGYRDNPMANSNFVGDFDVEWLLTKSGEIRLKAYNKTNDRYYTKTTLTTQGVGVAYKKDFNLWKDLLIWRSKIRRRREREAALQADTLQTTPQKAEIPQALRKRNGADK